MNLSFYRSNIEQFAREIGFVRRQFCLNEELYKTVKDRLSVLDDCPKGAERYTELSTVITQCFWGEHDFEVRVAFALVNVFGIMLDDLGPSHKEEYLRSVQEHAAGRRVSWSILRNLVDHTDKLMAVMPWFRAYLVKRAVDGFISFTYLEAFSPESFKNGDDAITDSFYRQGTSAYELYVLGVFPFDSEWKDYLFLLPHLGKFVNEVNDFLSYYKESIVCHEGNAFGRRGSGSGKPIEEVLVDSRKRCVDVVRFLQNVEMSPRLREALDSFIERFLNYHFDVDYRYRLSEVGIQFPAKI
ncbi:hypothetical protein BDV34DRAFT_226781 [Aspergillus parasiticus]|uniref:Trichodiene synthase n=1 Tax=Aspergillus parasiticus TaxID=5067 RepID=A0A5N6DGG0_ASPPA|nr:hypothetical protein BDV34DRAFT_226781 [Aspergillus parasiticus]